MAHRLLVRRRMRTKHLAASLFMMFTACMADTPSDAEVGIDPDEAEMNDGKADGGSEIPDVRCPEDPTVGATTGFRHTHNKLTAAIGGGGKHRGVDLVATSIDAQVITGELAYGLFDDGIDDEDVDLWACRAGAWVSLGTVRSGDDGVFRLELLGADRLPVGMRDMFLSVRGDRSSARFLAVVAPSGTPLVVSDIDGTLTIFEVADIGGPLGVDVAIHDGAPEAMGALVARGNIPIYLSARAQHSSGRTRAWLEHKGMPRGALRLADGVLLPGSRTVAYKTDTLNAFAGFELAYGVGNRASDVEAYTAAGVPANRIAIKLPEFTSEVQSLLDGGHALGFEHYAELIVTLAVGP